MSKDVPDAVSGGCVFDSPASPEIGHHVSGSPLKIIPKSPMRSLGDTASNDDEEEEDMDEDLLYLRLMQHMYSTSLKMHKNFKLMV